MRFSFATSDQIMFGAGVLREVGTLAADLGRRPLVLVGGSPARAEPLIELLAHAGLDVQLFGVDHEPDIALISRGVKQARDTQRDLIIGFGGGSVIDSAKAIAALTTNPGDPLLYLEVIGAGEALHEDPLPVIAIPTTAGTGAEVTRNAVLAAPDKQVKVSLRDRRMLPTLALIDPELTRSMPAHVTAYTGMDALTQVIEPFVSNMANPLTDAICREGIARAGRSLRHAYSDGDDMDARSDMALASLMGGLALANAKLGAVHGFAGPLGGMYDAPHGAICAALLAPVMRANLKALRARDADNPALTRYDEIGQLLTGKPNARAEEAIAWVEATAEQLGIPPLGVYGIEEAHFDDIIARSQRASSMKGNPLPLTDAELAGILRAALS